MATVKGVPQPFPYQGSKRRLAGPILGLIPKGIRTFIEPFAGSAAVTLAVACNGKADDYRLNDIHGPLVALWHEILSNPEGLAEGYEKLWLRQDGKEREFYDKVRSQFNELHKPHCLLYLLARCVKAAIRYNAKGEFNNSPDNRRKGMNPFTMRENILLTSRILVGRTRITCHDYRKVLDEATSDDFVYMDPPYQGVCGRRDPRYVSRVEYDEFADALGKLNNKGVPFIVSYDGRTGERTYGQRLPERLGLRHFEIFAGKSTQATLLGLSSDTFESLYVSKHAMVRVRRIPEALVDEKVRQKELFALA
jgi:DNA adenine methylase